MAKRSIDKTDWPDGIWKDEPDFVEFVHDTGFICQIIRHENVGHLCGYVIVPRDHPCFGKHYNDVHDMGVTPHGGLTFGNYTDGNVDLWKLGFDCAHAGDVLPKAAQLYGQRTIDEMHSAAGGSTYKTIRYVREELDEMCQQLLTLGKPQYFPTRADQSVINMIENGDDQ